MLPYTDWNPTTGTDVWLAPVDRKPIAVAGTPARTSGAALSPEGRYLAYVSDESGRGRHLVAPSDTSEIQLVLNWAETLKQGSGNACGSRH